MTLHLREGLADTAPDRQLGPFCRQCRGGDTWRDALVHQLGTIALFKTPLSRILLGLGRGGDDAS